MSMESSLHRYMVHNSSIIRINTFAAWYFLHLSGPQVEKQSAVQQTAIKPQRWASWLVALLNIWSLAAMRNHEWILPKFESASNTGTLPKNAQATHTHAHCFHMFSWGNHCKLVSWFSFFPVITSLSFSMVWCNLKFWWSLWDYLQERKIWRDLICIHINMYFRFLYHIVISLVRLEWKSIFRGWKTYNDIRLHTVLQFHQQLTFTGPARYRICTLPEQRASLDSTTAARRWSSQVLRRISVTIRVHLIPHRTPYTFSCCNNSWHNMNKQKVQRTQNIQKTNQTTSCTVSPTWRHSKIAWSSP